MQLDFTDQNVVVTGGTGALGAAVVELLVNAGATVHIPAHRAPEATNFPLASHKQVRIVAPVDLGNEQAVQAFYQALPSLWASIHAAGGFAGGSIVETTLAQFRQMFDTNAVTSFLCCREAVRKI